jgi:hypothetical protein
MAPVVYSARCKELSNVAWAFSAVGFHHDLLFSELARVSVQQLDDFKPEELSQLLHSFASLGIRHERLLEAGAAALRRMDSQTEHLTLALSQLRPKHKTTSAALVALLPRCTQLLGAFKPEELSSVALVAGKCFGGRKTGDRRQLPTEAAAFFDAAVPYIVPRLSEFSGQSLANVTVAFSEVGMGGQSGLFPAIAREVVQRVENIDDSVLLQLMRYLPAVPRCTWVHGAVCMLFGQAASRVNHLQQRDLSALERICSKYASPSVGSSREELCACCQVFAANGVWPTSDDVCKATAPAREAHEPECDASAVDTSAASSPAQGQTQAPLEVFRDFTACKDDLAATEVFRQCVETAAALASETAAMQQPLAVSEKLARAHVICSVKNTFLDVVESSSEDSEGEGAADQSRPLPPALDFITPSVSAAKLQTYGMDAEKLQAYRMDYQRFRIGAANGAKGEMASFVCDSLEL